MTDSNWCTIESDPGVFSELIERLGVQDTSVEEIWSLEAVEEQMKENAFGLVYLFKHRQEADPRPVVDTPEGMVFARQIVHNACATQAILGILLNNVRGVGQCSHTSVVDGYPLSSRDGMYATILRVLVAWISLILLIQSRYDVALSRRRTNI